MQWLKDCFRFNPSPMHTIRPDSQEFKKDLAVFQDFLRDYCEVSDGRGLCPVEGVPRPGEHRFVSRPELTSAFAMYLRVLCESKGKPCDPKWAYETAWWLIPYFLPELNIIAGKKVVSLQAAPLLSPVGHDVVHQIVVGIKLLRFPTSLA